MYESHTCTAALGESSQKQQGAAHPSNLERGRGSAEASCQPEAWEGTDLRGDIRRAPSPNRRFRTYKDMRSTPPSRDHNPPGVTDTPMNPRPTCSRTLWRKLRQLETMSQRDSVQAWGFPGFPKSVFHVIHLIPHVSERNRPKCIPFKCNNSWILKMNIWRLGGSVG